MTAIIPESVSLWKWSKKIFCKTLYVYFTIKFEKRKAPPLKIEGWGALFY